jgi:hypothetical protein
MTNGSYIGALRAVNVEFEAAAGAHERTGGWSRGVRRVWGVLCGAGFMVARASIYLVVLPLAAVACLTGMALYGANVVSGGRHG